MAETPSQDPQPTDPKAGEPLSEADRLVQEAMAEAQAAVNEISDIAGSAAGGSDAGAGQAEKSDEGAEGGEEGLDQSKLDADAEAEAAMMQFMNTGGGDGDGGDGGGGVSGGGGMGGGGLDAAGIDMLGDVDLVVTVELGRTSMMVEDVLRLEEGSVIELDKLAGDPVDVFVNDHLVARGEVLVLNDNFCIRISEIVADLEEQAEAAARQEVAAV